MHLDSSKICAAWPSTVQPHLGSDPAWICDPEKGWPHLSSSSHLICKTRIVLTQFAALWWRISEKHSGLVLIYSVPDGFYPVIISVASFRRKLHILKEKVKGWRWGSVIKGIFCIFLPQNIQINNYRNEYLFLSLRQEQRELKVPARIGNIQGQNWVRCCKSLGK